MHRVCIGAPVFREEKIPQALDSPRVVGGVIRAGALAAPALYPARFSTGGVVGVSSISSLCRRRQSSLISLLLLSKQQPLR